MVPRVDGIGDAGLQEPFLGNLVSGPAVVDLQESGGALPNVGAVVALAGIAESRSVQRRLGICPDCHRGRVREEGIGREGGVRRQRGDRVRLSR